MSDWLADYLDWMADHPELSTPPEDTTDHRAVRTTTMSGIYDDGATYGPDPDAQPAHEVPADPIYDDGAQYGPATEQ